MQPCIWDSERAKGKGQGAKCCGVKVTYPLIGKEAQKQKRFREKILPLRHEDTKFHKGGRHTCLPVGRERDGRQARASGTSSFKEEKCPCCSFPVLLMKVSTSRIIEF
jgi:hypothetical protein